MKLQMQPHNYPGGLITFCGLDGCGKTTQISHLTKFLEHQKQKVFLTKQPSDFVGNTEIFRTFIDESNNSGFDYRALSLLIASDSVQHSNKIIAEHLAAGDIVICEGYFYSCLAELRARGYTNDMWIYDVLSFIPKPDLAFFLDIDIKTVVSRLRERGNEQEQYIDMDLQYKLRDEYKQIAKENGGFMLGTFISEVETLTSILRYIAYNLKIKLR